MAIDLTKKRIPPIGIVKLDEADGSPMINPETGERAGARMHSPASKIWEVANAERHRKTIRRVRDSGGKAEASTESNEDVAKFLNAVVEEFIGVEVPLPEGESGAKALVRAVLADPELGYIRDQLDKKAHDWGAFLDGSPTG